jgi:hypothetical protein
MQNFAEQCADVVRSIVGHNLDCIYEDGLTRTVDYERHAGDEAAYIAFALGEYYRLTDERSFRQYDIVDLAATMIGYQLQNIPNNDDWSGYIALALLSFGTVKERNRVWEKLPEAARVQLRNLLLHREALKANGLDNAIVQTVARHGRPIPGLL